MTKTSSQIADEVLYKLSAPAVPPHARWSMKGSKGETLFSPKNPNTVSKPKGEQHPQEAPSHAQWSMKTPSGRTLYSPKNPRT